MIVAVASDGMEFTGWLAAAGLVAREWGYSPAPSFGANGYCA